MPVTFRCAGRSAPEIDTNPGLRRFDNDTNRALRPVQRIPGANPDSPVDSVQAVSRKRPFFGKSLIRYGTQSNEFRLRSTVARKRNWLDSRAFSWTREHGINWTAGKTRNSNDCCGAVGSRQRADEKLVQRGREALDDPRESIEQIENGRSSRRGRPQAAAVRISQKGEVHRVPRSEKIVLPQ